MNGRGAGHSRRGVVAVAMVATLVVVGLVIVGVVVAGAGDSSLTAQRADSSRAFYAAEAGVNMAVRELLLNSDSDGDGAVGTVSNDGNASNDPALGDARVTVSKSVVGTAQTINSSGRCGGSGRAIATVADNLAGGTRWMLYCDWPNANPSVMQWNGRGWGPPAQSLDNGSMIFWALLKRCVPRIELIAATVNLANECHVMVFNGTTWGSKLQLTSNLGTHDQRPFYIAYERSSGDGLVAFRKGTSATVFYRTWNGSAWSAELSLATGLTGLPRYMKLVPKPSTNEIMLVVLDNNNDMAASVWNGSAWTDTLILETNSSSATQECFDVVYETSSGRAMIAWAQAGNNQPQYRVWGGSAWEAAGAAPSVGAVPLWVRLAPNPSGNTVALATLDNASDVNAGIWDGSAWGAVTELATGVSTTSTRAFDIAWEPDGTRALCAYSDNNQWTPYYNLWTGGAWGTRQTGPDITNTPLLLQLEASRNGKEILLSSVISGGMSALTFLKWNGSSFANYVYLEENVSGPTPFEVFMLSDSPPNAVGASSRINGWGEVAP
jgi:hypothetical protein